MQCNGLLKAADNQKHARAHSRQMGMRDRKLAWLQALRGIAASMVVLVHSRSVLQGIHLGGTAVDHALFPMAMGVDLFFILSGFLMVWTTRDFDGSKAYAWGFLAKRFARIWPLFAVVTLAGAVVDHGFDSFRDVPVLLPYLEGLAFIPHDPAASPIYFHMAVGVAWTLCFEWYFYLVFAACMLFGRRRYTAMAGWFALSLIAIPLLRGGYHLGVASQSLVTWSRYANLAINPIVWDFVFGMLAGGLYGADVVIRRNVVIYVAVGSLLAVMLAAWHRWGLVDFFGPQGWGAPLAILFVGIVLRAKNGDIALPKWLVGMGGISYSLYLVHVYVFELVQRMIVRVPIAHASSGIVLFVVRPVLAVACAWVVFRCIEAPLSAWVRRRLLAMCWFRYGKASYANRVNRP